MSDTSQGPGWWQASDGKWYPPEQASGGAPTSPPPTAPPPGYGAPPGAPPAYGAPGAYGAPTGPTSPYGELADWPTRAAGYAIDGLAIGILANVFSMGSRPLGNLLSLLGLVFVIYNGYLNGSTGQSIGKRIMGTKVISEETGQPIGGGMGVLRWFLHIIDSLVCLVGWFLPLWDSKRQTISDKILKTIVVTGVPKKSFGDAFKG